MTGRLCILAVVIATAFFAANARLPAERPVHAADETKPEAAAEDTTVAEPIEPAEPVPEEPRSGPPVPKEPKDGEVRLPAHAGWRATLVLDNGGVGVWTVDAFPVLPQYGTLEIVGLDDLGRCHVLEGYSGRWKPNMLLSDRRWLGGLAFGDVDPRVRGAEIYTGGQNGNLYQISGHANGVLDGRMIGKVPGFEIHTIIAGDVDPGSDGPELLLFTRPGRLYRVTPTGPHGAFETKFVQELPGRFRDALVLPSPPGTIPEIATVSRTGHLRILRMTPKGAEIRVVYEDRMGMGRLALRDGGAGESPILYATHDDGRILRFERAASGKWSHEVIYLGPLGPRGVASGWFDPDPKRETVAVFGYSGKVQLLTAPEKPGSPWKVETLFIDTDKGHWLCAAEMDGRNSTDEIISSGYSGRIVMLHRPPGAGRPEATDPDDVD